MSRESRDAPTAFADIASKLAGDLDPSDWPVAVCPSCHSAPRQVPPGFLRQLGIRRNDYEPPEVPCDDCQQAAEADEREERRRAAEAAAKAEQDRLRKILPQLLARAGAPPEYARWTRATWEAEYGPLTAGTFPELLRRYPPRADGRTVQQIASLLVTWPESSQVLGGDQIVVLYGLYGVRKTGLATAILGEAIVRGLSVVWLDTATWLRDLKADGFARQDEHWQRAIRADVRLFDDFGSVVGSRAIRSESWDLEKMAEVSRYCHMHGLPTIYTTNAERMADLAEIDSSLPSRFSGRLSFKLGGRDRRVNP